VKAIFTKLLLIAAFLCAPLASAGPIRIDIDHRWTVSTFGGQFGLVQMRLWYLDLSSNPEPPDVVTVIHYGRLTLQTSVRAPTIVAFITTSFVLLLSAFAYCRRRWKIYRYDCTA
jgi:hypothetical protein